MKLCAGLICFLLTLLLSTPVGASAEISESFGYSLQRDIVFAQGAVVTDGQEVSRDLRLDLYSPLGLSEAPSLS